MSRKLSASRAYTLDEIKQILLTQPGINRVELSDNYLLLLKESKNPQRPVINLVKKLKTLSFADGLSNRYIIDDDLLGLSMLTRGPGEKEDHMIEYD